jgi:hypothetical protein
MVDKKVASTIASQAASIHMGLLMDSVHDPVVQVETSVYHAAFVTLLKGCDITPEIFEERIRAYAAKHASEHDAPSLVGNLLKESKRPEMGHKIFKRLVQAVFPAEGEK